MASIPSAVSTATLKFGVISKFAERILDPTVLCFMDGWMFLNHVNPEFLCVFVILETGMQYYKIELTFPLYLMVFSLGLHSTCTCRDMGWKHLE